MWERTLTDGEMKFFRWYFLVPVILWPFNEVRMIGKNNTECLVCLCACVCQRRCVCVCVLYLCVRFVWSALIALVALLTSLVRSSK